MMSKRVISFFSFGILLIIIGAIGEFLNWEQATIFLATGLTFETMAILLFAWNKIKK